MTWLRSVGLRLTLALGLAFSLWVFVSFSENPDQRTPFEDIPVEVEGLAPNLMLVDRDGSPKEVSSSVDVTVLGESQIVSQISSRDIRAYVDLTDATAGEETVPVNVVPTRSGLLSLSISADPPNLVFRIEEVLTRTVGVTVTVLGNVPFSYERQDPIIRSNGQIIDQVTVSGPRNRVERVASVRATADVDRLTANYNTSRPLEALDEGGQVINGVTIAPTSANVLVPIVSSVGTKRVPIVPQLMGAPAAGFVVNSITIDPQFLVLTGSAGALEQIRQVQTEPLDLSGISGTLIRSVGIITPPGAALAANQPSTASVNIEVVPVSQVFRVTLPLAVDVRNTPAGLIASLSDSTVEITLTGTSAQLAALGQTPLRGSVDAGGRGVGNYSLTPDITLPEGVTLAEAVPQVVLTLRAPATSIPRPTSESPAPTGVPTPPDATALPTPTPAPTDTLPTATSAPTEQPPTPTP